MGTFDLFMFLKGVMCGHFDKKSERGLQMSFPRGLRPISSMGRGGCRY